LAFVIELHERKKCPTAAGGVAETILSLAKHNVSLDIAAVQTSSRTDRSLCMVNDEGDKV
jgi:hypothetical protein